MCCGRKVRQKSYRGNKQKKMYVLWQTLIDVWIEICNTPPSHLLTFSNQINRQLLIRAYYGVTTVGPLSESTTRIGPMNIKT